MRRAILDAATLILAASLAAPPAGAADNSTPAASPPAEPSPWLFGDWNGERTRLKDKGIDFQFGYTSEIAYNATGGFRNATEYTDQYVAGVTLDLDRLLGLPSAQFQMTFTQRTGRNLADDAGLGTFQLVQEVFGRGQTARLTDFWYRQEYLGGLIDWKIGRMGVGEDFAAFSCDFQNLTFCGSDPGNIVGNYIYNWPMSQWATRVKVRLDGFGYAQVGVYDVNEKYLGVSQALAAGLLLRLDRRPHSGRTGLAADLRQRPAGQLQIRRLVRHLARRRRRQRRQWRPFRHVPACRRPAIAAATAPTSISSRT